MTPAVRNPIGWRERLADLRGEPVDFDLQAFDAPLAAVRRTAEAWAARTNDEILAAASDARQVPAAQDRLTLVFGLVCEAARRTIGQSPFDEQIVAALAMAHGRIVEMQTGEGKTLAATLPVAFWALDRRGVHVLTFNDYLARRDAEWMGPIYRALGLSVGFVQRDMAPNERRRAYGADITYVTAKESGFDHLRDLCAASLDDVVHRPFHVALVDEADSLLIDEARVPLVLAGSAPASNPSAAGEDDGTVTLLSSVVGRLSPGVDFVMDEHGRNVELTDAGLATVERALGRGSLHESGDDLRLSQVNCALHARALLRRGVDYLVRDGRIEMIDEMTGRAVPDRRWPEGLQSALDAKEGLTPRPEGQVMASMSLQRFLRGYPTLAGMTGTAQGAAAELHDTYGRRVAVIPTHRPSRRIDHPDVVFTHREAKDRAIVTEVIRAHRAGRPVLAGTLTVEESDRLAARVREAGVPCQVLNAAHDAAEAAIVARAGEHGAVTIATNMAGRGTDIRLGGPDEADHARVVALGGLLVIGTNRHESRRVDRQLRGRAGRQGDPGETRFFVSLEDDLLVRHGGLARLIPAALVPARSNEPVEGAVLRREIARAQRVIEGQHWDIRRLVARYAGVVERQFETVVAERVALLRGEDPEGETLVDDERLLRVAALDRLWREHLARCADLRDGAHLARLGGRQPLDVYTTGATASFGQFHTDFESAAAAIRLAVRAGGAARSRAGLAAPATTWTYLVNDDPFRHTMGSMLTGPGGPTIAMYAAATLGPLFLAWGVVDRWWKRKNERPK